MKTILIVSFYDLKDYFNYIKEQFESYYFKVINYPLFQYAYDVHDKIDNYIDHMNQFIIDNGVDIILWWFIDVPCDVFKHIRKNNRDRLFIMFNTDDPCNINKDLFDKGSNFDIIMTPCKNNIYLYKTYSKVNDVIFNPFGFDPNLFKKINYDEEDKKLLECDVSMLVYNMFLDKEFYRNQEIYKTELIERVIKYCEKSKKSFKLFGSPILKELFGDFYHGDIPYYKQVILYNCSKINIVSNSDSTKLVFNDNTMSILGSEGLLFIDEIRNVDTILSNAEDCFIYNRYNLEEKLDYVLDNFEETKKIKLAARDISLQYSWDEWVKRTVIEIGKKTFNENFYRDLYGLTDIVDLFDYWIKKGIDHKHIPFVFEIPECFDYSEYINKNSLNDNKYYAYLHWFINSQNKIYMTKKTTNSINFDSQQHKIITEDLYTIFNIFNKIKKKNRKEGLLKLDKYCSEIPYIKINEILDYYNKTLQ